VAEPMPPAAPVTMATLLSTRFMGVSLLVDIRVSLQCIRELRDRAVIQLIRAFIFLRPAGHRE